MIAGIRGSGAEKETFHHNDLIHLEQLLAQAEGGCPKVIAFESLYSMDGDIAPIGRICDLAAKYGLPIWTKFMPSVSMATAAPASPSATGSWTGSTSSKGPWRRSVAKADA